jgi:polyvinyl alcohol dehydrogenase (cytochrome)
MYGHDLANTRTQAAEHSIGAANAGSLASVWVAKAVDDLGAGAVDSTPVVADGCVFVTSSVTNAASLFAFNADTGALAWTRSYPGNGLTLVGGAAVGSVAVDHHRVYLLVSEPGDPYAVALDEAGHQLWGPKRIDGSPHSFVNASAAVYDGKLIAGFSGYEADDHVRGGYTVFDAADGAVLAHRYTIDDTHFKNGEWGASVWATPAVDTATGALYVGTGNPSSRPKESPNADAILKIDVRGRPPTNHTFGDIVAVYHGNPDHYAGPLNQQPACQMAPDVKYLSWSATCLQLDLDFGGSPNLFRGPDGGLLVGALQKAGVYHAAHADTMAPAWKTIIGGPGTAFNGDSTATDGHAIFAVGAPGGVMAALDRAGGYQWASPLLDGIHYQSVSTANGVVYTVDGHGFLDAWTAGGVPLLKHPLSGDAGDSAVNQGSSGVAIARGTVYVAVNQYLLALRPGGKS